MLLSDRKQHAGEHASILVEFVRLLLRNSD